MGMWLLGVVVPFEATWSVVQLLSMLVLMLVVLLCWLHVSDIGGGCIAGLAAVLLQLMHVCEFYPRLLVLAAVTLCKEMRVGASVHHISTVAHER